MANNFSARRNVETHPLQNIEGSRMSDGSYRCQACPLDADPCDQRICNPKSEPIFGNFLAWIFGY